MKLPLVEDDPAPQNAMQRLLRLFTHLLLNAIRHSPEAGCVSLEVTAASRGLQVAVCVQGPGIPSDRREQVFDHFWSGVSRPGRCVLRVELPAATDPPQTSWLLHGRRRNLRR